MGFGCSYSGVDTEGVEVKIPFDKRPKTRVQGVGFYALCGDVVPLFLLQVRFCRGGGVRGVGVGCRVTLIIFPRRVNLITGVGLVMPHAGSWGCGLLVDDWVSGG